MDIFLYFFSNQDQSLMIAFCTSVKRLISLDLGFQPPSRRVALSACVSLDLIPKSLQDICCSGKYKLTGFCDGNRRDSEWNCVNYCQHLFRWPSVTLDGRTLGWTAFNLS